MRTIAEDPPATDQLEGSLGDNFVDDPSSRQDQDDEQRQRKKKRQKKKKKPAVTHDQVMRYLFWMRAFSFVMMLGSTVLVCYTAFKFMKEYEAETMTASWEDLSPKVVDGVEKLLQERMEMIVRVCAVDVSLTVSSSNPAQEWPHVGVSDFETRAASAARLADAMSMGVFPIVTNKEEWHAYSQETLGNDTALETEIWRFGPQGYQLEDGPGPYLVQWQAWPAIENTITNYNLASNAFYANAAERAVASKLPVLVNTYNLTTRDAQPNPVMDGIVDVYNSHAESPYDYDPVVSILFPVLDDIQNTTNSVVAILLARLYWRSHLIPQTSLLPDKDTSLDVVLSSDCGAQQDLVEWTYRMEGDGTVKYLGNGDRHDEQYTENFRFQQDLLSLLQVDQIGCHYDITVYPTADYEYYYRTHLPAFFAVAIALTFFVTSIMHFVSSCFIERRKVQLIEKARKSTDLVNSLFPKDVRKQVYADHEAKMRGEDGDGETAMVSRPANANLYPECTICFGDIAGFTKWSSSRSPTQVFELLEAIYGTFDKIADRLKVYKIETIGDCYVCATGLPKKQNQHAVIMARFADECLEALQDLIETSLRDRLGEDTSGLAMRFGLHSGPVTAGVLRGDKSRFQIFGDTVNTAARMESNGTRAKIQVSEATATLLRKAGKELWLTAREDLVSAKGKGMMQCYWVQVLGTYGEKTRKKRKSARDDSDTSFSHSSFSHTSEDLGFSAPSHQMFAANSVDGNVSDANTDTQMEV